ncbi:hypothetical protein ACP70R_004546 [Stipagrostis hirtigluma subsp. patula]
MLGEARARSWSYTWRGGAGAADCGSNPQMEESRSSAVAAKLAAASRPPALPPCARQGHWLGRKGDGRRQSRATQVQAKRLCKATRAADTGSGVSGRWALEVSGR